MDDKNYQYLLSREMAVVSDIVPAGKLLPAHAAVRGPSDVVLLSLCKVVHELRIFVPIA